MINYSYIVIIVKILMDMIMLMVDINAIIKENGITLIANLIIAILDIFLIKFRRNVLRIVILRMKKVILFTKIIFMENSILKKIKNILLYFSYMKNIIILMKSQIKNI
jgi:hypothetical protein